MKKIFLFLSLTLSPLYALHTIDIAVTGVKAQHTAITIIVLNRENRSLIDIATIVEKSLNFTDQFKAHVQLIDHATPKRDLLKQIKNLCSKNIPTVLCLNINELHEIEWSLYDTMQCSMLAGKKYPLKRSNALRSYAYHITDKVMQTLTGNEGPFSSRIVYCKDSPQSSTMRQLYIADIDGTNTSILFQSSTPIIAPRWNTIGNKQHIHYSEYTDTNVQLVSMDMQKNKRIVSDLDGINMLLTISPDESAAVYCASNGQGNCQLYYQKNGKTQKFTRNNGNNVSPVFIDNDHICFCSDAQTGSPQIYIGNLKTGHVQRITKGGYCTSPDYCAYNNTIVYHAKIDTVMQLCSYNYTTKKHAQLTYDKKNKHEACWSPCGRWLLFSEDNGALSRIGLLNINTKKKEYVTPSHERCSYPHWSSRFTHVF